MALPLANGLEGGTSGAAITAANSGGASGNAFTFASTAAPIPVYSVAAAMHGTKSCLIPMPATVGVGFVEWDNTIIPLSGRLYGRAYVQISTVVQTTATRLVRFLNIGTIACSIGLATTGAPQIFAGTSGNTAVGTAPSALVVNTWYRFEWDITFGTGTAATIVLNVYAGDSTTVFTSVTATGTFTNTVTGADTVRFGVNSGGTASVNYYFDDIQINATGFPGPAVAAAVASPKRGRVIGQAMNRSISYMRRRSGLLVPVPA